MKNIFKVFIIMILTFVLCVPTQTIVKASIYTNMGSKEGVVVSKSWTVSFNKPLNTTTVNTTNIKVVGENNNYIDIKVSLANSNKNVIVQPVKNYEYNKAYTLIVTQNVQSSDGKPLQSEVRMNFNTESAPTETKFIVCINAARGGSDDGGIGPTGLKEKDVNLDVALRLGNLLEKENVQVVYTRSGDSVTWNTSNEIQERINIANNANSDLLVTISCNSYSSEASNGIETYYLSGNAKSKELAEYIQAQLIIKTAALDRGTKESNFNSLQLSNAPGVLATLGFITNTNEESKLKTSEYKDKLALAFTEAIKKYISLNPKAGSGNPEVPGSNYKVVLDAGHGGFDPGAIGPTKLQEKAVALAVTLKVGNILAKNGVSTIYTRTSDNITWSTNQTQNLQARCDIVNNANPNLFVSIHCNSYTVPSANGIETWYYAGSSFSANSAKLAGTVQSELIRETGRTNRGTKTGNLYVTKYVKVPAILVETSFISNPDEEKLLATEAYQNKLAKAISTGILKNLGITNIVY